MFKDNKLIIFVIIVSSMIGQFAIEIYLPSMPKIADDFHVALHLVQLTIAIYILGFASGGFISGSLSDLLGRRPVMLWALSLGIIGGIICCFVLDLTWLYLGRFIQGLGLGGASVVCRSICKDIAKDGIGLSKLTSLLSLTSYATIAFAPVIGGYIQQYLFWHLNFVVIVVLNLLVLGLGLIKLVETHHLGRSEGIAQLFNGYLNVIRNHRFILFNLLSAATLGGVIAYQSLSANLLELHVGLSPATFGYTGVLVTMSLMIGGIINARMVARVGLLSMMRVGFLLFLIAGVLYLIFGVFHYTTVVTVLLPVIFYGLGATLVYPNVASGAIGLHSSNVGTASAIFNCIQMLGGVLGCCLVSLTHDAGLPEIGLLFFAISMFGFWSCKRLEFNFSGKG